MALAFITSGRDLHNEKIIMNGYKIKSEVCLTPGNCYPVNTELPLWIMLVLFGASAFLVKEIINSIQQK